MVYESCIKVLIESYVQLSGVLKMPRCKFCCCCCYRQKREDDIESEDETMELDHRPRAPIPTNYGGTSQPDPIQHEDNSMRPRLPTRKKLKHDRESVPRPTGAATDQSVGRIHKNIEALHARHENLEDVDEVISDMESEAGIYSSLSAQLREKYQQKFSSSGKEEQQLDVPKKKKRKLKAVKHWWRKHFH